MFFSFLGSFFSSNLINYLIFLRIVVMGFIILNFRESFYLEGLFFFDGVRLSLVVLRIWVTLLIIYSRYKIYILKEYETFFRFFVYFLFFILLITFFRGNFIFFYFFFEISLIPTLLIIIGWGYQPERLQAGIYFLFYTLTASLPLLIIIIYLFNKWGSLSFLGQNLKFLSSGGFSLIFVLGVIGSLAFLVKLPMYFTHLWLPKAHVEAPVAGSIILAGVLLKLGGYGLMRVSAVSYKFLGGLRFYLLGLSLVRIIYVGFICCRINDFKALVAYSSVAHIGIVICGVVTIYNWGFYGGLIIIISHGISSSGLFCIVNIYYERVGRRSFYINRGLLLAFPIFSMAIFLLRAANIAAPPTINLLSEIFLMVRIIGYDIFMFLIFPLGSFIGAVFTLFIFSYSQHGSMYFISYGLNFSRVREIHTLFLHIIPVNFLILNSSLLITL